MGKNPKFGVRVRFRIFDDKCSVLFEFRVLLKIRFVFGSSSVNAGFGFGSGSLLLELERCLCGHLLRINCNCKYRLIN